MRGLEEGGSRIGVVDPLANHLQHKGRRGRPSCKVALGCAGHTASGDARELGVW